MTAPPSALHSGIGWILRVGVALSLVLESAGLLLSFAQTGDSSLSLSQEWLAGGGNFFGFTSSTLAAASQGVGPVTITALGVIVLLLTPYVRVLAAIAYYAIQKDWKYAAITLFVFAVITLGLSVL